MIRTARGPGNYIVQLDHEPQPPHLARGRGSHPRINPVAREQRAGCARLTRTRSSLSTSWINRKRLRPWFWLFAVSDGSHLGGNRGIPRGAARTVVTWPALRTGGSAP